MEPLSIKATQHALGTLAGVVVASLFMAHRPPVWGLVIGAVLAGLRPLLKARNYLVWASASIDINSRTANHGNATGHVDFD